MAPVLVVEDDADIREVIGDVLDSASYATQFTANGVHALNILSTSGEPMVVVLNHRMPGMTSEELLEVVVTDVDGILTRHRFIEVTAANVTDLSARFKELLADLDIPIIHKPFDIDALLAAVAEAQRRIAGAKQG